MAPQTACGYASDVQLVPRQHRPQREDRGCERTCGQASQATTVLGSAGVSGTRSAFRAHPKMTGARTSPSVPEDNAAMSKDIGKKRWAIAEGYIPPWSHGPAPEMASHEAVCLPNPSDREAHVTIVAQHTRLDSRQAENARMTTIAAFAPMAP